MTVDWITVSAQIVNFLVLVWLLRRFLYQPVVRAMDRREQRITERLEEARAREQAAEAQEREYREEREGLDRRRAQLLEDAKQEADQSMRRLLEEARESVNATREEWLRQAEQEKEDFLRNLRREITAVVEAIARRALGDLAGATLEERMLHRFLEQLEALDDETRAGLAKTSGPVRIISTFELESAVRGRITRALHVLLAEGVDVRYECSDELLCGLELVAGARRVGFSLAGYLEDLSTQMEEALSPLKAASGGD